jgi:hypothetical protein
MNLLPLPYTKKNIKSFLNFFFNFHNYELRLLSLAHKIPTKSSPVPKKLDRQKNIHFPRVIDPFPTVGGPPSYGSRTHFLRVVDPFLRVYDPLLQVLEPPPPQKSGVPSYILHPTRYTVSYFSLKIKR